MGDRGSPDPGTVESGPPTASDGQDFAAISSVVSGSAAVPTGDDGGDDSAIVLESLESVAWEMSAGTQRQSQPENGRCDPYLR